MIYFISKRFTRQRTLRFANYEILEKVYTPTRMHVAFIPMILRILAISLIILALSDIELTGEGYVANTDFVLAIDTSSSMLTPDYEPDRLTLAKKSSMDWIRKLEETRIGVVTFAGGSYTRIKPTNDLEAVEKTIERMSLDKPAGTAIGEALITASSLLHGSERNKTIILITDGRNNIGVNITEALRSLKNDDIRVIAIGIGSREGEDITVPPELAGQNVTAAEFPGLDEESMRHISNETGGKYFYINDEDSFKMAFESGVETRNVTKEVKNYFLIAACIILLMEWAFEITKYRPIP
ncbi:MAG: VWA domain-containing protein [Candidatus Altiarchaeota archaeon]|nr:VWA domain-containing protein [Candidatus Altiarchaeota archaeon]